MIDEKRAILHLKAVLLKYGIQQPEPGECKAIEAIRYADFINDLLIWRLAE